MRGESLKEKDLKMKCVRNEGEGHLYIGGVLMDLSTKGAKSLKEKVIFQFDLVKKKLN